MISQATFLGGARTVTISADTVMALGLGRVWIVTASTPGLRLRLPNARNVRLGGPLFMVVNNGVESFDLCDNLFNVQRTMAAGDAASVWCSENTGTGGEWHLHTGTANNIPDPPSNLLCYLFGGETGGSVAGTELKTREYDQQLEVWSIKTDFPVGTTYVGGSVCVVGAKAYCCGASSTTNSTRNVEYDPDTYTTRTSSPSASSSGLIDACGIQIGSSAVHFNGSVTAVNKGIAYEYSPGSDAWTNRAVRPSGRGEKPELGVAINAGKAYLAGGLGAASTNAVDEYVIDTYTAKANRPAPFAGYIGVCTGDDDLMWVYGGSAGATVSTTAFSDVRRYDPGTDAWTSMLAFGRGARTKLSATSIQGNNHIFGGHPGSSLPRIQENTEHAIATDTYLTKPDIPQIFESVNQARAVTR